MYTGDDTREWIVHVWEWAEPRFKSMLLILIAVVVVIAVVWITVKRQESYNLKAQLEYFEISKVEDPAARNLKLEDFAKKYQGEEISFQALMFLGEYYYNSGELEKAAAFYTDVLNESEGELMYYLAVDALAPVYVSLGKTAEAAELYLKSAEISSDPNPFVSKLKAANLFKLAGDSDKAKEICEELIENEETPASIKLKAEEQLLWIAVSK